MQDLPETTKSEMEELGLEPGQSGSGAVLLPPA